jgi:hypothetical protein
MWCLFKWRNYFFSPGVGGAGFFFYTVEIKPNMPRPRKQKREFEAELEPVQDPLMRVILRLHKQAWPHDLQGRRDLMKRERAEELA